MCRSVVGRNALPTFPSRTKSRNGSWEVPNVVADVEWNPNAVFSLMPHISSEVFRRIALFARPLDC